MSGRTVLALVVAPIIAGATYGILVFETVPISAIMPEIRPEFWVEFAAGVVAGVVFELFVLLPLLYLLDRTHVGGWLLFMFLGTLAWFLVCLGLLSLGQPYWNGRLATSLMFLPQGIVLVLVFGAIVRHGAELLRMR